MKSKRQVGHHGRRFVIGGNVIGLAGSGLVLQNNAADDLTIRADGTFVFATKLASKDTFDVTVKTQPLAPKQSCVVSGGKGIVAKGDVTTVTVNCATDTFTVGGTVSGLAGTGLILQNNARDPIPVNANGVFAFPVALADGSNYAVTVQAQPTNPRQTCSVTSGSGKLASENVNNVRVDCVTDTFSIGGTVSGLAGTGLLLQDNRGDDLPIRADGTFAFSTPLADLSSFEVTVKTQPSRPAQTCTVTGGSGTLAGNNVTSVLVNCSTNRYAVGGTVSGLVGSGLVLTNNDSDALTVAVNGTFAFAVTVADQSPYDVRVIAQPTNPSQTCTVANGNGNVAEGAVSNISVTCTTNTYVVGGTLSGLANAEALVLQNSGGDDLTLNTNGPFTFPTLVESGATYLATVRTNPSAPVSQTCTVTSGSGTVTDAAIASITVTCVTNQYTVGGIVSGLSGTGLVLRNNGGDDLSVNADGTFTFASSLESGASYDVSIQTQPSRPAQTCIITGSTGTVASGNIVSVAVNCVTDTFTVGGTVSGLVGVGLVLQNNGGDDLAINANGTFAFATPLADLSAYSVTVRTQPTDPSQTCTVSNGSGNVLGANATNVAVNCITSTFSIGGSVTGLGTGQSVILQNNGGDTLTVSANSGFVFATPIASGSIYNVTVATNPPGRTCTVLNASGTVTTSAITNVAVTCTPLTFTIGGNVSGLGGGQSAVLQNNGTNNLTVSVNGGFTFTTPIAIGSTYNVTVATNPLGRTCTVSNGSGTVTTSAITNVVITCTPLTFTIGGFVSGLGGGVSVVLQNNGINNFFTNVNGGFTFATPIASGATYNVTVATNPSGETCTVSNGSGTVVASNVTNVSVNCVPIPVATVEYHITNLSSSTITLDTASCSPGTLIFPPFLISSFSTVSFNATTTASSSLLCTVRYQDQKTGTQGCQFQIDQTPVIFGSGFISANAYKGSFPHFPSCNTSGIGTRDGPTAESGSFTMQTN